MTDQETEVEDDDQDQGQGPGVLTEIVVEEVVGEIDSEGQTGQDSNEPLFMELFIFAYTVHVCVYTNLHSPRTVELSKILSYLIMSNLTFNWSCSLTKNLAMSFTCIKLLFLLVGLPLLQNEGERGMNYCNIHCTLLELLFQAYVF